MLLLSSAAFAQSSSTDAMPGHGFVTFAPLSTTNDAQARLLGARRADDAFWLLDATVFLSRNAGIGIEVLPAGAVTLQQSYSAFFENSAEEERAVLLMARTRALATRHVAVDVVFGGGIAQQHWAFHAVNRFPTVVIDDRNFDANSAAMGVGVDGPLSLIPHVALIPLVRLHLVNHTETESNGWSTRFAVGIGAGVKW